MILYRHISKKDNKVFYIGISKYISRAFSKRNRNKYWLNLVNKYGYYVEIIYETDSWVDLCELEVFMIEEYGRRDLSTGNLVNMTDGGEGTVGLIRTEEHKKKIGLGNKGKIVSEEVKSKIRKSHNKKVLQLNLKGEVVGEYESTLKAEELTGVYNSNISSVCNNKRVTAGGYKWKYKI